MEHTYSSQDSFPHQNARVQYVPYFQPTPEVFPSQMMFDPSKVPIFHGNVRHGATYSYPCHSCCNTMPFHNHHSYGPCLHAFPPQPSPWWGSYPVYPQLFPAHALSPSAYVAEFPRYEYAKDVTGPGNEHCCGCPNHVCKPKNERSIKIEEQKPSLEKEKPSTEGVGRTLPVRHYQYPIIWMPPEYVKNKEGTMPSELESMDPEATSQYLRPQEKSSHQEPSWKGFFPLRWENLGLQTRDGDDYIKRNQPSEDSKMQFSHPVIWMPYARQQPAEREETKASPQLPHHGPLSDSHVNTAKGSIASGRIGENGVEGNVRCKNDTHLSDEHASKKNIPLKEQENTCESTSDVSSKGLEEKGKGSTGRKQPASPKEKPKPPPVSLRVDPLPKRKNTSSSLRSPSPPDAREDVMSGIMDNKESKPPAEAANEKRLNQEKRKEVKAVEVRDSYTGKIDAEMAHEQQVKHPVNLNSLGQEERNGREVGKAIEGHEAKTLPQENTSGSGKMEGKNKPEDRILSETVAATLIQAAYRGFEMRKWETRKKLKQMARIHGELAEIKKNIQDLECSSSALLDQEKVTKQRMVISESIMSLLLSLDTIQGLHSSLRDVRKSLARELVALQERLDFLVSKKSDDFIDEQMYASINECIHEDYADDTSKQREDSREADMQSIEGISRHYESSMASQAGELPENRLITAEVASSSLTDGRCSDQMVNGNNDNQKLESSSSSSEMDEVESDQYVEQDPELSKSSEAGKCENMGKESDEASSIRKVKDDGKGKFAEGAYSDDPVGRDQESERGILVESPNGALAGQDAPYEDRQQDVKPLEILGTWKNGEDGGILPDENETPQKEHDGGDMVPVLVHEEGAFALSNSEMTVPGQIEAGCTYLINSEEEKHTQNDNFDVGDVLPVSLPEEGMLILASENSPDPENVKDENVSYKLSKGEVFTEKASSNKQIESNAVEQSINQGKEIEEKHGESVQHEPERLAFEKLIEHPVVTEAPEKEFEIVTEDKHASDGVVMPCSNSKSRNSKPDDELKSNEKLLEENAELRELMQKLMEAGKEQLDVISSLTGRVRDLEKRLAKNKRMRSRRCKTAAPARLSRLRRNG